jgi:hypothetical protein
LLSLGRLIKVEHWRMDYFCDQNLRAPTNSSLNYLVR